MSWNALYILMLVSLMVSLLQMLKRSQVSSFLDLLSVDKVDVLILLCSLPFFCFYLYQNASVNYYDEFDYLGSQVSSIFRPEPERARGLRTYGYCGIVVSIKLCIKPRWSIEFQIGCRKFQVG